MPPATDNCSTSGPAEPKAVTTSHPPAPPMPSHPTKEPPWSVESALASLAISPPPPTTSTTTSPIPTLHLLERLKTTPREGWRRFSVPHPESVADHMYRMSIITLLAPSTIRSTIDISKATRLALVHDMAEAVVGDITPIDPISKKEKSRREADTMGFLATKMLGGYEKGERGRELRELWEEYEAGETAEARFVKDVDKLELLCQMVEYEKADPSGETKLGEFAHVQEGIRGPEMRAWAEELMEERTRFFRSLGMEPEWGKTNKKGEGRVANGVEEVGRQAD